MEFIQVEGTSELEFRLIRELDGAIASGRKVLFLLTGGSNIAVGARIINGLKSQSLSSLQLILTDERYGPVGHVDSNYFQLHQAGLKERDATFKDLLTAATFEETVTAGAQSMEEAFNQAEVIIGFFGMGPDGHIAGILPHSPAAVSEKIWMIGYDGGQFMRFTLTPFALSHIPTAYLSTFGAERKPQLERLRDEMLPLSVQPVQILRHIPKVFIYNNQIGD